MRMSLPLLFPMISILGEEDESGDEENASVGLGATRAPTGREGATFVTGRPSRTRPEATYIVWLGRQAWVKHYSWVHALVVQPIVPDS